MVHTVSIPTDLMMSKIRVALEGTLQNTTNFKTIDAFFRTTLPKKKDTIIVLKFIVSSSGKQQGLEIHSKIRK